MTYLDFAPDLANCLKNQKDSHTAGALMRQSRADFDIF
jgi:hypothetical protein